MGRLAAELKKLEAAEAKRKKKEDLLAKVFFFFITLKCRVE